MRDTRYMLLRLLPPVACAGFIFFLSSTPGNELHAPKLPGFDKFAHLLAYGVLSFLIYCAGKTQWIRGHSQAWALCAIAIGCLYGASDEWHQLYVPMRSASVWDWGFDAAGTALGVLVAIRAVKMPLWRRLMLREPA